MKNTEPQGEQRNPIAKKIHDLGGIVIPAPIFNSDGSVNQQSADQLFAALDTDVPMAAAQHIRLFAEAILHGSDAHKAWLVEAAEAYITGNTLPPPRA